MIRDPRLFFVLMYDPVDPVWCWQRHFPSIPFIHKIFISWVGKRSAGMAMEMFLGREKYWGIYYEYDGCATRTFRVCALEIRVDFKKIEDKNPWKIGFGI